MKHMLCIATEFTLCGESRNRVQTTLIIEEVDCEICIRRQFEGEVEYLRNIKIEDEDRVLSWFLSTLVAGAIVLGILWFLLFLKG